MAAKRAGVITIDLVGRSSKLQSETKAASTQLGQLGAAAQGAGRSIGQGMATGAAGVRRLGEEADKATGKIAGYGSTLIHIAEATTALVASHTLAAAAIAKTAASSAASVTTTNELVNGYRLLRIVLSPTVFTAASIATGILVEETIRLVNARARLIDQQAAFAASNRISFQSVDSLDAVSKVSGANSGNVRSLFTGLRTQFGNDQKGVESALRDLGVSGSVGDPAILGRIAAGFHAISDPARQAELATRLFGDQSAVALSELNGGFARGAAAVQKYGIAIDELSRTQIHQFRQDLIDLKSSLTDFSEQKAWWESFKTGTEIVAAAAEDMSKRGIHALDNLISDYLPGMDTLRLALGTLTPGLAALFGKYGPAAIPTAPRPPLAVAGADSNAGKRIVSQDVVAEVEGARARHAADTIEGQRATAEEAARRSREALDRIKADDAARESFRTARQFNPAAQEPPGLLTTDQRFSLSLEAKSSSDLAKVTSDHVKVMESAKEIASLLRERFTSINTDLKATAQKVKELSIPPGPARERARIEDAADRSVESFRREARATLRDDAGNPIGGISDATASKIRALEITKEEKKAEEEWRSSLNLTLEAIEQRIKVQNTLNAAIGKTADAVRAAAIEGKLIEKFGADYSNPAKQADVGKVRTALNVEDTSKRSGDLQKRSGDLENEISLELALADAQLKGADALDAVRRAEASRKLEAEGLGELTELENDLLDARKRNADNAEEKANLDEQQASIDRLDLEIEGEKALTKAQLQGADAVRKQAIENKLALLDYDSAATKVFETLSKKTKDFEDLKEQAKVTQEALATARAYTDRLSTLEKELSVIQALEREVGATRDLELDRKRIEEDIRETLARQALAVGTLTDGYKAFFTTIGQEAEKPGVILNDSMHRAIDDTSNELSKLLTGQKTNWKQAFQSIGQDIVKRELESSIKKGLGALGDRFPDLLKLKDPNNPAANAKRPTGTPSDPIHVYDHSKDSAGSPSTSSQSSTSPQGAASPQGGLGGILPKGGLFGDGSDGGFIFSLFPKLSQWGKRSDNESGSPPTDTGGLKRLPSGLIDRTGVPGPTGNPGDPVHVIQDYSSNGPLSGLSGLLGQGGGGLASILSSFGGGGAEAAGDGIGSAFSTFSSEGIEAPGFASGTSATPVSSAYWVGERGPELEINNQPHTVVPLDKLGRGGDTHIHQYNMPGADIGAAGRLRQMQSETEQRSVAISQNVSIERDKRTPKGAR